jgi:hypothetical protein
MFNWFRKDEKRLESLLEDTRKMYEGVVKKATDDLASMSSDVAGLKKEKLKLTEEVEKLKIDKKIADEDIRHMVKMKEGKLQLEFDKKAVEAEREKEAAIAKVKDEYRDKMEQRLIKEGENIKEMYTEILKRLPDVNVALGNAFKEKSDE